MRLKLGKLLDWVVGPLMDRLLGRPRVVTGLFLTSYRDQAGDLWEGPTIRARSWWEAERKAKRLSVYLDGELRAEYDEALNLLVDYEQVVD